MNDTIKTIMERKSCKNFIPDKIPCAEDIDAIIKCGLQAPSAMNTQAWHLTVLTSGAVIDEMNSVLLDELDETARTRILSRGDGKGFSVNYRSPVFIIVSFSDKSPFPFSDCACLLENMFLAASSLNLGSCWINQLTTPLCEKPAIRRFLTKLGVPQANQVYGCCALGYSAAALKEKPRAEGTVSFVG